jgi:hypothetical protein
MWVTTKIIGQIDPTASRSPCFAPVIPTVMQHFPQAPNKPSKSTCEILHAQKPQEAEQRLKP